MAREKGMMPMDDRTRETHKRALAADALELTEKQIKALSIIKSFEDKYAGHPIMPKIFAKEMWPDSPAWRRSYNTGPSGACRGKGMWLSAGSWLRKLERLGLVRWDIWQITDKFYQTGYVLTRAGRAALAKIEETST